ncbi:hypothetical protein VB774_18820 [Pseudanabaena galeata UHCC 0370]|uniref:Uncharacterized protein n=1 Tax=Pseudanabaena galeata UHCC 0370 TaxID=3110310 RepID=A0ABU5TMZ4_9CYAN|nr:hypothetical protein [Pseudanabaena galeata]MEA5479681.1 hypothetical protein [Pseudanabaena galeata UHCC 0370]
MTARSAATHLVGLRMGGAVLRAASLILVGERTRSRQPLDYCETRASEYLQNKSCRNHAIAIAFGLPTDSRQRVYTKQKLP